ncbi:MAG: ATP-binding cassette domain-containing protein [Anaerolineae bacterium]
MHTLPERTEAALEIEGLRKEYEQTVALDDLNLTVNRGEVFGFLGPNGAGKTTAVKCCLDLVRPTAGTVRLLGRPSRDWRARSRVGFLPEHFRFQEWLTATEFLEVHGRLQGVPEAQRRRRAGELLELLDLSRHAQRPLKDFSKGMLQRTGLAQALINDPELVFLDEPTSGLDPLGRRLVRELIQDLRRQGTTVFLNSHLLSEIEVTCDRVAFIRRGRVVHCGTLNDLLGRQTEVEIRLEPGSPLPVADLAAQGWSAVGDGDRVRVQLDGEEQVPDLVAWLVGQGLRIRAVSPQRRSLEEAFLGLMEGEEAG